MSYIDIDELLNETAYQVFFAGNGYNEQIKDLFLELKDILTEQDASYPTDRDLINAVSDAGYDLGPMAPKTIKSILHSALGQGNTLDSSLNW